MADLHASAHDVILQVDPEARMKTMRSVDHENVSHATDTQALFLGRIL
jgi:hypothetical protein